VGNRTVHLPGVIRNTSGTAGINKSGVGTLLLTAANTYNGDTTISAGTISIDAASNIGGSGTRNLIMTVAGCKSEEPHSPAFPTSTPR
jgi:autotransporter-associated beta strand protein